MFWLENRHTRCSNVDTTHFIQHLM
jgi:hypothetical protein